jgi:D-inositol-3-phosphate glycosyltransferase
MYAFVMQEDTPYQLIHANFFMSALVASELKRKLNIPFVVTFHALGHVRRLHQGDQDKFPEERLQIEESIVQDADQIIAECPQDKDDLIRYYEAPEDRITVIPCGFNPAEFYPLDRTLARRTLNLNLSEKIILQLGRMVPRKGVDNVIRALANVMAMGLEVRLLVVGGNGNGDPGNDPEIARLLTLADELGVTPAITFTGKQSREVLKYYYSAADLFITTPWYEPFGITPLESMACGTPVIGSAVGGIKYTVEDGRTGYLVPPNDPEALGRKICQLLMDPGLLQRMKRNAIRRVNNLFTWTKVAGMVATVYEHVLLSGDAAVYRTDRELAFIEHSFEEGAEAFTKSRELICFPMMEAASLLSQCFLRNKKVLVCVNGGSAAESQHFVAELLGRFEMPKRQGLPAIALTADSAILTAWSNDVGFDDVFSRQVEALGQKGDVLFCISTSGQSANLMNAMKMAARKQMSCIALTGKGGGEMALYAQVNIIVPSYSTQRIQEVQLHVLHTLCSLIEAKVFGKDIPETPEVAYPSEVLAADNGQGDETFKNTIGLEKRVNGKNKIIGA